MPTYRIIDDLTPGDSYDIVRDVESLTDVVEAIASAALTIKIENTDPDAYASVRKDITDVYSATHGELVNNVDGTATLSFTIQPSESINLESFGKYLYDIQVTTASGKKFTLEQGKIFTLQNISHL